MISIVIRTIIVCAVGLVASRICRRVSASAQHAVAFGVVLSAGLVLLLSISVPTHTIAFPIINESAPVASSWTTTALPVRMVAITAAPIGVDWNRVFCFGWAAGAAICLLRLMFGLVKLRRRILGGKEIEGLVEGFTVVEAEGCHSPAAAWLGRHTILLPTEWCQWDSGRLRRVLDHELAHVRRLDAVSQLTSMFICALIWPNPLIWVFAKRARELAEEAADDVVLAQGARASSYATDLLELAKQQPLQLSPTVPMSQTNNLSRRIEMILDPRKRRGGIRPAVAISISALAVAVCIPISTWAIGQAGRLKLPGVSKSRDVHYGFHWYGYDTSKQTKLPFTHTTVIKSGMECGECHANPQKGNDRMYSSNCFTFLMPEQAAKQIIQDAPKAGERLLFAGGGITDWTAKLSKKPSEPDACSLTFSPSWISDKKCNVLLAIAPNLNDRPEQLITVDAVVPKGSALVVFDSEDGRIYIIMLQQLPEKKGAVSFKL